MDGSDRFEGVLPVTTIEDLSRADLGDTHRIRMVIHEEMAGRAQEYQARMEERYGEGQGGGANTAAQPPPGHNPFHSEEWEKTKRHEE